MVVPDFELICEIMLVAEGFLEARLLARKFITLYSLCKELLSKQVIQLCNYVLVILPFFHKAVFSTFFAKHGQSSGKRSETWLYNLHSSDKKGSPYSITKRRVPELIPVPGSQLAGDVSHKPGGRLPLLSARPAVTLATLKRAATNFAAW